MKTGLLGIFADYESAELARAILLVSAFPIDRITLTTLSGQGYSSPISDARDKFLASLRRLFKPERRSLSGGGGVSGVEGGEATVSACAHNPAAAGRIARILKDCGATYVVEEESAENRSAPVTDQEEAWPRNLSPAA